MAASFLCCDASARYWQTGVLFGLRDSLSSTSQLNSTMRDT
jgi:hypothetical protein